MSTIKDKINLFSSDNPEIHLFKEGIFIKMYNESAYLFTRYLKPYKVNIGKLKKSGEPYFHVGFPSELLKQKFALCTLAEVDNKYWIANSGDFDFSSDEYATWKREAELKWEERMQTSETVRQIEDRGDSWKSILREVSDFRLDSVTPIECVLFLSSIQKKIHGALSESTGI